MSHPAPTPEVHRFFGNSIGRTSETIVIVALAARTAVAGAAAVAVPCTSSARTGARTIALAIDRNGTAHFHSHVTRYPKVETALGG